MKYKDFLDKKAGRNDTEYMRTALQAAEEAKSRGDLPIGAVLCFTNGTYVTESSTVYTEKNPLNHAEMNLLRKVAETNFRQLKDSVLYCNVEPCVMCAAAAMKSGVSEIIFGVYDPNNGFTKSTHAVYMPNKGGILAQECFEILPQRYKDYCLIESSNERSRLVEEISNRLTTADDTEKEWLHLLARNLDIAIFKK